MHPLVALLTTKDVEKFFKNLKNNNKNHVILLTPKQLRTPHSLLKCPQLAKETLSSLKAIRDLHVTGIQHPVTLPN